MRIVLTWEEFKMIELLLIDVKQNTHKKERGSVKSKDYEVSWNEQMIIVELQLKQLMEKVLFVLEGLEGD